jgi:hypothetical protein
MKKHLYILVAAVLVIGSCHTLDLNPLSEPSTGNFYSNATELTIAVNDLYRIDFIGNDLEDYSDNYWNRATGGNAVTYGTMASDDGTVLTYWTNCYKAIARANTILASLDRARENTAPSVLTGIEAQARFARAYQYSRLITHFGDVPFLNSTISLDSAYQYTRTSKDSILQFVFSELDYAAENLPATYSASEDQRWTKGAALAIKARTALYTGHWEIAAQAAHGVMDLAAQGVYALYPSFRDLFLSPGETSKEIIMSVIQSQAQGVYNTGDAADPRNFIPRNTGGYGAYIPTWSLMDAFECTDGQTIDKSKLYDPHHPFANRDPRLSETIVPFGTPWLGYDYQPHPDSVKVMDYSTGQLVKNNDTRSVAIYASYTGLLWKKGIDQSWADNRVDEDDILIVRYAEMLLTYAEAKIELNEIDPTVLDAINQVRARAYGVDVSATTLYPAITTTDQQQLRSIVRRERRVEFANEGLRYMDLMRWKVIGKALTRPAVGLVDPANQDRSKWPFPGVLPIDADGIPDFSAEISAGEVKVLALRSFDTTRQYLWPIPAVELRVNPNITQNPNY